MTHDPLLADFFDYVQHEHEQAGYARNPDILCRFMGITLTTGTRSLARARRSPDDLDLILLRPDDYGSRDLFTVAHEVAHILARRGGYLQAIRHYHADVSDLRLHVERVMNHAAGLLLMPGPDLTHARRLYGDAPEAIIHLAAASGASEAAAMRRWTWQDAGAHRAAFTLQGGYVTDLTACRARLPFSRWERLLEVHLTHPDVTLLYLGGRRVLGTVA